jgi:hypothetical protein
MTAAFWEFAGFDLWTVRLIVIRRIWSRAWRADVKDVCRRSARGLWHGSLAPDV